MPTLRRWRRTSIEIATDWLAAGLDPERCTMFLQSAVPEHAELHLLLSMITPLGWLERVPTYKEALDNINGQGPASLTAFSAIRFCNRRTS